MTTATRVTERCTHHGEGAFWDGAAGRLLIVDMMAGAVVEVGVDGTTRRHDYGGVAALVRRRASGGFVSASEHGIRFLGEDLEPTGEHVEAFEDPAIRMNEGGCDSAGRLLVGTMAYDQAEGAASMWRFDPDGAVTRLFGGVTISNGLQWSADGASAFYVDTPTDRIDRFDYDVATGTFSARRPFARVESDGHPDGCTIDAEGGIWVAIFGGGAVHRYDADGSLTDVVEVSASQVTSCALGGADLRTLYITTSREDLPDDAEPEAGSVFSAPVAVPGVPLHAYAG